MEPIHETSAMRIQYIVLACAACLFIGFVAGRSTMKPETVIHTVREPVYIERVAPASVSEPIGRHLQLARLVFIRDTASADRTAQKTPRADSAIVELPIRDYTFTDDSTYTVVARGVHVESLPRIEFRPRTVMYETKRRCKVEHGFQIGAGAAWTPHGVSPAIYAGYGVTLKF